MPADGLPLYDEVRYIHVARDGRDALMSMHNHYTGYGAERLARFDKIGIEDPIIAKPFPRLPADPASFFRLWLSTPIIPGEADGMPGPSFFDLEVGYWAERGRPNVLLVHYNDLLNDRDEEMRRVAAFLEIEVDETVWPTLVQAASFEHMREAASELMPQASNVNVFFNKGTNGRWRNLLTEDDLALYDAKVREKFTPQLASWLENGRQAVGGDPSDIAG
jgi:aryl sulfotransferase